MKSLLEFTILATIVYLLCAVIGANFNAFNWSLTLRIVYVIWTLSTIIGWAKTKQK